jgi:hypothetical protein
LLPGLPTTAVIKSIGFNFLDFKSSATFDRFTPFSSAQPATACALKPVVDAIPFTVAIPSTLGSAFTSPPLSALACAISLADGFEWIVGLAYLPFSLF